MYTTPLFSNFFFNFSSFLSIDLALFASILSIFLTTSSVLPVASVRSSSSMALLSIKFTYIHKITISIAVRIIAAVGTKNEHSGHSSGGGRGKKV